ncbi:MAG: radical SAM protein [Candidatus Omnitrophica bacterium]|nr:radical SAM protein [Candidatus Omnitrophota bacterium]
MEINAPVFCDIGITENCIFKCKMCRLWESRENTDELSIEEWKYFIDSLAECGFSKVKLHFAGGEPLVKKGVIDVLAHAHRKGFTTVMVTNGFLIDEAMAARIASCGLDVISISLDTLDADMHDSLRGVKGAHAQAMRAIKNLKKEGVKSISILAVIMGPNIQHLVELVEWANNNNDLSSIYLQAISQPIATDKDDQWYERESLRYLWPHNEIELDAVMNQLIEYKRQGYKISNSIRQLQVFKTYFRQPNKLGMDMICSQGNYVMYIRPSGDVLLCGSRVAVGNIKDSLIKDIWYSTEAMVRREQMRNCKESCLNVLNCFENKKLL